MVEIFTGSNPDILSVEASSRVFALFWNLGIGDRDLHGHLRGMLKMGAIRTGFIRAGTGTRCQVLSLSILRSAEWHLLARRILVVSKR